MIISAGSPSKTFTSPARRVSLVKVVVLGPQGVGCTALIKSFVSGGMFDEADEQEGEKRGSSLGAKFHSKMLLSKDDTIRFQIWDIPSASTELIAPIYYSTANICLVCFDLTRPKTLALASQTLKQIMSQETPNIISVYVLVGCKLDRVPPEDRATVMDEANALAEAHGCSMSVAVSAKDRSLGDIGIQHVFLNAALLKLRSGSKRFLKPPEWVPDADGKECFRCKQHFTTTRRRHHCRQCGNVFDSACCSVFRPLPRFGMFSPVRVCVDCNELLDNDNDNVMNGK